LTENISEAEKQLATTQPQINTGLGAGKGRETSRLGASCSAWVPGRLAAGCEAGSRLCGMQFHVACAG